MRSALSWEPACSGTPYIVKHKSTSAVWLALPSQTAICATKCRKDHSRCGYLNAGFCHHRLHSRFSSCPQYYIQFFTPVLYTVAFYISHIWEHEFYCLDRLGSHGSNRKFLLFCFYTANISVVIITIIHRVHIPIVIWLQSVLWMVVILITVHGLQFPLFEDLNFSDLSDCRFYCHRL